MAQTTPKNIVIIGGSLGGLFCGIPLLRLGHNVTILERTASSKLKDQGAGIATSPVSTPILQKYLQEFPITGAPLMEFLSAYDRTNTTYHCPTADHVVLLRKDGTVKVQVPGKVYVPNAKHFPGGCSWDILYNILRANFDGGYKEGYVPAAQKEESDGEATYLDGVSLLELKEVGDNVEVVHSKGSILADFVIGADGQSSTVGRLMGAKEERKYAGYVGWRGTVREGELDEGFVELLQNSMTGYFGKGYQVVIYQIPGKNGTVEKGDKLANICWYSNVEDTKDILTDVAGTQHRYSLGVGTIRPEIKEHAQKLAKENLPPQIAKFFGQVEKPFIQAITDKVSSKASFLNGKVVLVGDALFGFRPHTAAGAQQAALHALLLKDVFEGKTTLENWEEKVLELGSFVQKLGVQMGDLSQFGDHPLADNGLKSKVILLALHVKLLLARVGF